MVKDCKPFIQKPPNETQITVKTGLDPVLIEHFCSICNNNVRSGL